MAVFTAAQEARIRQIIAGSPGPTGPTGPTGPKGPTGTAVGPTAPTGATGGISPDGASIPPLPSITDPKGVWTVQGRTPLLNGAVYPGAVDRLEMIGGQCCAMASTSWYVQQNGDWLIVFAKPSAIAPPAGVTANAAP